MSSNTILGFGVCTALFFIACSQNRDRDQQSAARTDAGATAAEKPAPFDNGPVKIALVQYSGAGHYFEQWTAGAQRQAEAVGFTMQLYDARADDARQAADMKTATASRVAGIIVDHGRSPTMCPLINQATDAGIAVVVYDVKVAECAPQAVETAQNDADLATLVLTQMAKDIGDGVPVGYVNPFVIARSSGATLCGRSSSPTTSGTRSSPSVSLVMPWRPTTRSSPPTRSRPIPT